MAGSAVWYHVVSGRKVFLLAPPTAANLAAYEAWAGSERQACPHLRQLLGLFISFMRRAQPRCEAGLQQSTLYPWKVHLTLRIGPPSAG